MIKIRWSQAAVKDLQALVEYLDADGSDATDQLLVQFKKSVCRLHDFPELGRIVPEFRDIGLPLYRELIVARYRVIYCLKDKVAMIIALIDQRQNVDDVLMNRLMQG